MHGTRNIIMKQSKDASLQIQALDPSPNKDQVGESQTTVGALQSPAIHLHTFTDQFLFRLLSAIPSIFLYR